MAAGAQRKKRQHYVPRFYLERFGVPGRTKPAVYGYKLADRKVFGPANLMDVARENFFYDLDEDPTQDMENALASVEGRCRTALARLVAEEDADALTVQERDDLAFFLALQYFRTKRARHEIKLVMESVIAPFGSGAPSEAQREELRKRLPDVARVERMFLAEWERRLANYEENSSRTELQVEMEEIRTTIARWRASLERGEIPSDSRSAFTSLAVEASAPRIQHVKMLDVVPERIASLLTGMHWKIARNLTDTLF